MNSWARINRQFGLPLPIFSKAACVNYQLCVRCSRYGSLVKFIIRFKGTFMKIPAIRININHSEGIFSRPGV